MHIEGSHTISARFTTQFWPQFCCLTLFGIGKVLFCRMEKSPVLDLLVGYAQHACILKIDFCFWNAGYCLKKSIQKTKVMSNFETRHYYGSDRHNVNTGLRKLFFCSYHTIWQATILHSMHQVLPPFYNELMNLDYCKWGSISLQLAISIHNQTISIWLTQLLLYSHLSLFANISLLSLKMRAQAASGPFSKPVETQKTTFK